MANDYVGDFGMPYVVPLLGVSAQWIVLDTSNSMTEEIAKIDVRDAQYRDWYDQMNSLSNQANYNIAVNHHPI